MSLIVKPENLEFLKLLSDNNDRDWFAEQKKDFKQQENHLKKFFLEIFNRLNIHDQLDTSKVFRIYRDVRFSKNKLPYKTHFAASYHRVKPDLRGGYYVHIEPNDKSFLATGFWNPEKEDLFRIRKELEMDAKDFRTIIGEKDFRKIWGDLQGEELKSAPRDFDKDHVNIDLIRKKQFVFRKSYTDKEVLSETFLDEVVASFQSIRPYFNYMSEVLTTNLNGESTINQEK
ncbi:TIGR02453 family protein [Flavobacteriaceae bacterium MAR_2010_188]|nr:TIGR02453 family protein [Flavobacteriaceae bacterium MAR_2010_188]